ncbi:MAG: CoA-binding protein [Planctomycetota bacterium]
MPAAETTLIQDFLAAGPWAVVGASTDRSKYGNKVLRCYQQAGKSPVYPVHPREREIEGLAAYPSLTALPERPRAISIITPPKITEAVVEECATLGIRHLWMQPGAESPQAVERCAELGLALLAGGPCLLVVLRYQE